MNLVSQIKNIDNPQTFNELCDVLFNSIWGLDYEPIADDQSDRGNDGYRKSTKTLFAKHCFRKRQKSGLNSEIIKKAKEDKSLAESTVWRRSVMCASDLLYLLFRQRYF